MMCEKRGPAMVRETLNSFVMHVEDEIYDGGADAKPKAKAKTEGQVKPAATAPGATAAAPVSIARPAAARQ
jgi:chemotaxis protein MotA